MFNFKLFKEGMRQSKVTGILFVTFALIFTCLSPSLNLISHLKYMYGVNLVSCAEYSGGLLIMTVCFSGMLILSQFDYLFKRGSSDFYHALPYTRTCICFTGFVVCLCWALEALLISLIAVTIIYAADPCLVFKGSFFWYNLLAGIAVVFHVTGAMLIGAALAGKKLGAATLGAFIAFIPRVFTAFTVFIISEEVNVIDSEYMGLFSIKYNTTLQALVDLMPHDANADAASSFLPGMLMTLGLGIIYIILGIICFNKRKSEVAENAVAARKLNTVTLVLYPMVFIIPAFVFIMYSFSDTDADSLIAAVVFLLFGLLMFVIYAFTLEKKFKGVIKRLPLLGVCAVIGLLFIGVVKISSAAILNDVPGKDDIKEVKFAGDYYGTVSYVDLVTKDVSYSDEKIISIVADAFKESVDKDSEMRYLPGVSMQVEITLNSGRHLNRSLRFTEAQADKIAKIQTESDRYLKACLSIPEKDVYSTGFKSDERNKEILNCFIKEYNSLSDKEKQEYIIFNSDLFGGKESQGDISVVGYYGNTTYEAVYDLNTDLLPETTEKYYKLLGDENNERLGKIYAKFDEWKKAKNSILINFATDNFLFGDMLYNFSCTFVTDSGSNAVRVSFEVMDPEGRSVQDNTYTLTDERGEELCRLITAAFPTDMDYHVDDNYLNLMANYRELDAYTLINDIDIGGKVKADEDGMNALIYFLEQL